MKELNEALAGFKNNQHDDTQFFKDLDKILKDIENNSENSTDEIDKGAILAPDMDDNPDKNFTIDYDENFGNIVPQSDRVLAERTADENIDKISPELIKKESNDKIIETFEQKKDVFQINSTPQPLVQEAKSIENTATIKSQDLSKKPSDQIAPNEKNKKSKRCQIF